MAGSVRTIHPLTLRKIALVLVISFIVISSVITVDVHSAGYEYEMSEPTFSHGFPDTIFFYNISEGVTSNTFSFIVVLPTNHSGHHHIIPREISLLFWFKDASDGSNLSSFINSVCENLLNGTFSFSLHKYHSVNKHESGWWAPSLLHIVFNDRPTVDLVEFGVELELILLNSVGDDFNGHELSTRLEMNVTYSRWWNDLLITQLHQTIEYAFDLPDDAIADIQSLEYGLP